MARKILKTLKFRHCFVQKILDGRKTITRRLFDDKNLKVGDKLEFVDLETGEKFARARIVKIREKKLGELAEEDFNGHGEFENKKEMLAIYRKYYGNKVTMDTFAKIVEFDLLQTQK